MHGPGLATNISYCLIGDQPVVLDLDTDEYFLLAAAEAAALKQASSGKSDDPKTFPLLSDAGLVDARSDPAPIEAAGICSPRVSIVETCQRRSGSAGTTLRLAVDLFSIRRRLRHGGLATLVRDLRCRTASGAGDRDEIDRQALIFATCRRWIPVAANCLLDSLALCFFLARHGLPAKLVLGVKLDPFAAHAWVQHGETVLNDSLDGPLDFTPILVV